MIFEDKTVNGTGAHHQAVVSFWTPGRGFVVARGEVAAVEIVQPLGDDPRVNLFIHLKSGATLEWGPETLDDAQESCRILFGHDRLEPQSDGIPVQELEGLE